MNVEVMHRPSYAIAYCHLRAGESLRAETGSMALMSDAIEVSPTAGPGGIGKAFMRRTLGEETLLMANYRALAEGAWVAVAPKFPGDVCELKIDSQHDYVVQSGSCLALSHGVEEDVKYAGLRNVIMHEGVTMLRLHGEGSAVLSSYGALQTLPVQQDQRVIVDTGHLVAYTTGMKMRVGPLGGVTTSILTGEGLVAQLSGPGEVVIQTRAEQQLRSWLLPDRQQNEGH